MVGYALLIVPGVIFALWLALTTQAVVVEGRSATAAMGRSKQLASGNLGKVFAVYFVTVIIGMVLASCCNSVGVLAARQAAADGSVASLVIRGSCSLAGRVLGAPIYATALILLYYDLRIRKEAFDLEMLAQTMDSGEA